MEEMTFPRPTKQKEIQCLILAFTSILTWLFTSFIKPAEFVIPPNFVLSSYPKLPSTVPMVPLDIVAFGLIFLVVFFLLSFPAQQQKPFHAFAAVALNCFVVCTVGTFTNLLKFSVGRPRPNMYAICGPNATLSTCTHVPRLQRYDTFASWPSGHASVAMSATSFLISFLHHAAKPSVPILTLVLLTLLAACLVGGTRIRDYKHHPDDVVSGFLLGLVVEKAMWPFCKSLIFARQAPGQPR